MIIFPNDRNESAIFIFIIYFQYLEILEQGNGRKMRLQLQKTLRARKDMRPWKGKDGGNKQEKRGRSGRERAKKTSCSLGNRLHEVHYSRGGVQRQIGLGKEKLILLRD